MHIDTILRGINQHTIIKITYRDKEGRTSVRETEPYEIKAGRYFGYCLEREAIRGFALNNILKAELTNKTFVPRF